MAFQCVLGCRISVSYGFVHCKTLLGLSDVNLVTIGLVGLAVLDLGASCTLVPTYGLSFVALCSLFLYKLGSQWHSGRVASLQPALNGSMKCSKINTEVGKTLKSLKVQEAFELKVPEVHTLTGTLYDYRVIADERIYLWKGMSTSG